MILSPGSFFCPGSALGRHLMGSDEEQVGQSNSARSSVRRRGVTCGLTWSIVPATGPCSGRRLVLRTARTCNLLSLAGSDCRRFVSAEFGAVGQHTVQHYGELAR